MTIGNSEILYRGWQIEPFAIPCADGSWEATCEITKLDGTSSDGTLAMPPNVVRQRKEDAIADICEQARHIIDASGACPYQTEEPF